jgi:hypothetical protein
VRTVSFNVMLLLFHVTLYVFCIEMAMLQVTSPTHQQQGFGLLEPTPLCVNQRKTGAGPDRARHFYSENTNPFYCAEMAMIVARASCTSRGRSCWTVRTSCGEGCYFGLLHCYSLCQLHEYGLLLCLVLALSTAAAAAGA